MIAKRVSGACAVVLAALLGFATLAQAQPVRLMDRDITEAYQYVLGRLDLDAFVSERIGLAQVDKAFETMKSGKVLRSVVEVSR